MTFIIYQIFLEDSLSQQLWFPQILFLTIYASQCIKYQKPWHHIFIIPSVSLFQFFLAILSPKWLSSFIKLLRRIHPLCNLLPVVQKIFIPSVSYPLHIFYPVSNDFNHWTFQALFNHRYHSFDYIFIEAIHSILCTVLSTNVHWYHTFIIYFIFILFIRKYSPIFTMPLEPRLHIKFIKWFSSFCSTYWDTHTPIVRFIFKCHTFSKASYTTLWITAIQFYLNDKLSF